MTVKIKYFGLITEVTQCDQETMDVSVQSISELLETLYTKYPDLKNKDFQVAQNQELVSETTKITGEELALLPPFSGG